MQNMNNYDAQLQTELLDSFTGFLQSYSKLLDAAEKYEQNVKFAKLIDNTPTSIEMDTYTERLVNLLTNMVPFFVEFSYLEDTLEQLSKR